MAADKKTAPKAPHSLPHYPLQAQDTQARQRQQLIEKIVAEEAPLLKRLGR